MTHDRGGAAGGSQTRMRVWLGGTVQTHEFWARGQVIKPGRFFLDEYVCMIPLSLFFFPSSLHSFSLLSQNLLNHLKVFCTTTIHGTIYSQISER